MRFLSKTLTVDTGWNTGWAYWIRGSLHPKTGILIARKELDDPIEKIDQLTIEFNALLYTLEPRLVYLEGTQFWEGSIKSEMAWKTEDLIYLSYLIGGYIHVCLLNKIPVIVLTAVQWKGQMTDEQVRLRVGRRNGADYSIMYGHRWPHVTDAVGIGLSVMGIFNKSED